MVTFLDNHKSLSFFLVSLVRFFLGLDSKLHLSHTDFKLHNKFINDFNDFLAMLLIIVWYEYCFWRTSLHFDF